MARTIDVPSWPEIASNYPQAVRDEIAALVADDWRPSGAGRLLLWYGLPGTGKTHTAAALLTHLLAQGKRILVTAHTDQALKEVRAKLPEEIRPLAVAVVGTEAGDMADLKTAVNTIPFNCTTICAALLSTPEPSVVAKMPDASAPQAPPRAWTPKTSNESS